MFLFLVLFTMQNCAPASDRNLPKITFMHLPPIQLEVTDIKVLSHDVEIFNPPDLRFRLPVTPKVALERWATDRLRIAGNSYRARLTLVSATVTESKLPVDGTIAGIFKQQASEKYSATIEATLEIIDNQGKSLALAQSQAKQMQTVREDTSLSERRRILFELVEILLKNFDDKMDDAIKRHLSKHLS